jgi:hypothetical protein
VLQIPIHPICEGLFLEAGARSGHTIAKHLTAVVRARINSGEPAFVYGHPERRLARFPEVLGALSAAIAGETLLWRVTLTEFAEWWHWRDSRRWSLISRSDGRFEVQLDDWRAEFPLALEIVRGTHLSAVPIRSSRTVLRLEDLAYERRHQQINLPSPTRVPRKGGLRAVVRKALDWETVTPLAELHTDTFAARVKKGLRWWREEVHQ